MSSVPVPLLPLSPARIYQFVKRNGQRFLGLVRYRNAILAGKYLAVVYSIYPLPASRHIRALQPPSLPPTPPPVALIRALQPPILPPTPPAVASSVTGGSSSASTSMVPLCPPRELRESGWVDTVFDDDEEGAEASLVGHPGITSP